MELKKKGETVTKRQRRKLPNDKHKWPQHPKIQSMDARNKAYIRVAGLGSSLEKKKQDEKKPKDTIEDSAPKLDKVAKTTNSSANNNNKKTKKSLDDVLNASLDINSPEVKFGRLLGGTDQRKRHATVLKLKSYLQARCNIQDNESAGISELDLLKLWKGLWYTLYMADKVPVQDELSKRLAELIWSVAGTEEEDEYAGQAYLDMCGDDDNEMDCGQEGCDECEDDEHDHDHSDSDDDSDSEDYTMEIVGGGDLDDDDEEDSDEEEEDGEAEEEEGEEEEERDDHDDVEDWDIKHCRGAHLASLFVKTFFRTLRREWGNMDKYRVDKFYTLVRLFMHEVFKYMATRHWNLGIIRLFNDCIFEEVLNRTPNGLCYHLIDLTLEELAKVNAKAPMPLTEATFLDTLEPYFAMAQTGAGDPTVQERVVERILAKFLEKYSVVSDNAIQEEEEEKERKVGSKKDSKEEKKEPSLIFDQVHVESVGKFIFELASDPETHDRYRKSLYNLHKTYMRRLKKVGKDVEIQPGEGDEDERRNDEGEEISMEGEDDKEDIEDYEVVTKSSNKKNKNNRQEKQKGHVQQETTPRSQKRKQNQTREAQDDGKNLDTIAAQSPKGKKKRKVNIENITPSRATTAAESTPPASVQRKRSKNQKIDDDDVITISLSEQKRAKAEERKSNAQAKNVAKEKNEKTGNNCSRKTLEKDAKDKRVKFDSVNRSKSWKASMKALVTTEPPKTSISTPEKGILLNKGREKPVQRKGGRKRASNYF